MDQLSKNKTSHTKDKRIKWVCISQACLEMIPNNRGIWYETPEEIEQKILQQKKKKEVLNQIRRHLIKNLSPRERKYLILHYFDGLSIYRISKNSKTNPATVFRTLRRALRKLKYMVNQNSSNTKNRMKRKIISKKKSNSNCSGSS